MQKTTLLLLVILCEGYIVLACELLAIRQMLPFIGSGTECVAIIISGVLLPLAVGYHAGGEAFAKACAAAKRRGRKLPSIRGMLLRNILIALAVLTFGLSYPMLGVFFGWLGSWCIGNRLAQAALYALLFLVTPIFLLGQTVPLVSNYFSRQRLSAITGRMLCFSTTGSFLGSVFSTVVLMNTIGVHNTVIVTLGLLSVLGIVIARDKLSVETFGCLVFFALVCALNSYAPTRNNVIVGDNAYNIIAIQKVPGEDIVNMRLNNSLASRVSSDPQKRFAYVRYIEDNLILPPVPNRPKDILILGAGGFTMGLKDTVNRYTFVDIDKSLKEVAEAHFLPGALTANKRFVATSARSFVHNETRRYDVIVLDTYNNTNAIPMETTTREYLQDIKSLMKDGGVVVANIICSPSFKTRFSVRYDNTFASVFPRHGRQVILPVANDKGMDMANVLYVAYRNALTDDAGLYTDDKNTYSMDSK